jgi:hypothetical protein
MEREPSGRPPFMLRALRDEAEAERRLIEAVRETLDALVAKLRAPAAP